MNIALFAIRHSLFHTARIRRRDFFGDMGFVL